MPATEYWDLNGDNDDLKELFNLIGSRQRKGACDLEILSKNAPPNSLEGWLFGGCFSVLTNLIGTPYFPKSLNKAIVFIEDIGETDLKLGRYLNQWIQSGSLSGVSAIILGTFKGLHTEPAEAAKTQSEIWSSLSKRLQETRIPVFGTHHFGHQTSNFPLMLGANGSIANSRLNWEQVTEEGVS
jgi:muramoyltetrapeptide carboxypeptidase